jgi:imidazolonepropionase-like amidohydrolase
MHHRNKRMLAFACSLVITIVLGGIHTNSATVLAGNAAPFLARALGTTQAADLALVGGTLIDGRGGLPVPNAVIMLRGDRIINVGTTATLRVPAGTPIHDLRGKTILPGLINAHVHTSSLPTEALKGWPRAGVTTVLDLAGPPRQLLERRRMLTTSNDPAYPRLLVAGPFITVPGGHPIPHIGLTDEVVVVRGPADARAKVSALLDAGVNMIKIVVSGRTDMKWPELSNEEIAAITSTAHARGIRVVAHIDRASAMRRAVENGIDDAVHMPRDRMPDDVIALMVKHNVTLVPTIDVYEGLAEGRGIGDDWRKLTLPIMQDNLRRFIAAGGTLALGDDYGGHESVALGMPMAEIEHWQRAGVAPMQILVAATQGSARLTGLSKQLGTIQPGMLADLLVVNGDPLKNMATLNNPSLVIRNGKIVKR